ncbi:transposase [Nonomuraea ferruginea]
MAAAWGGLVRRLEDKAPGRVVKVNPAYTSQRCSACGIVDREARESQARYRCRSCGYAGNADVNAARNIAHAAGHAVSAREGHGLPGRCTANLNATSSSWGSCGWNPRASARGGCQTVRRKSPRILLKASGRSMLG